MEHYLLSIIVPAYNMEGYLPKCLGSLIVVPKLMEKFEVIVVNDGSKDRTSDLAHEFEVKYPLTFKVIDKTNGHYGSCINVGLKAATGIYVKLLDADDSFDTAAFTHYLANLVKLCEKEDKLPDVIINERLIVDAQGRTKQDPLASLNCRYDTILGLEEGGLLRGYISMHKIAHKRANLVALGYKQTERICYTDNEWVQAPFVMAKTFIAYDLKLYCYLVGRSGQSVDNAALHKNLPMWIKESKVLLGNYEKYSDVPSYVRAYMKFMAEATINTVYKLTLTRSVLANEDEIIKELDDYLFEKFPAIYDEMEGLKAKTFAFSLRYIKEWRRKRSRRTLRFFIYRLLRLFTGQRKLDL